MSFKFFRNGIFPALIALGVTSSAGFATDHEVINFSTSPVVVAGESVAGSLEVNEYPVSVTFTSVPAGLVSYTAIVPNANATVQIPTNTNASAGSYVIRASPSSGGVSKDSANVTVNYPVNPDL